MAIKCFFFGHQWKTKYQTESKDLCECERCGAKEHYDRELKTWSKKRGKLVRK